MINDLNGRQIQIGDVLAYAVRRGNKAVLAVGIVARARESTVTVRPVVDRQLGSDFSSMTKTLITLRCTNNALIIKRKTNVQSENAASVPGSVVVPSSLGGNSLGTV